jgi:mannose-1-phosphate guanylyltransferase
VTWATLEAAKQYGEEAILGFFPADHWIADEAAFFQTVAAAAALSEQQGAIATLGIQPTFASTGYGYIEQGESLGQFGDLPAYRVSRFTEKPDPETAQGFVDSGKFCWNGGMFIFQIRTALAELRRHAPEIIGPLEAEGLAAYPGLTKLSIDYALMEKTDRACVLPVTFGWDDLGDWNAIERLLKVQAQAKTDAQTTPPPAGASEDASEANVALCDHIHSDSEGCILYSQDGDELIATIGLKDVVIVRAGKATLIVDKHRTQDIKPLLQKIRANPRYDRLL